MSTEQNTIQVITCKDKKEWEHWLEKNYSLREGVFLRLFRKDSGKQTFTYDDALEIALCFGWIDGQVKKYDEESWIQKFTPRRPKGLWSKRNTVIVERLIKEGRMMPTGLKEVEDAKQDGRWDNAYESQKNAVIPKDFLLELEKNDKAKKFYQTLSKVNLYAIYFRLHTATSPQTREKRMKAILERLEEGKAFY